MGAPSQFFLHDMQEIVRAQLPERLRGKVDITISSDPARIRVRAVFADIAAKRVFECQLERQEMPPLVTSIDHTGRIVTVACRIPEVFLTHLCAVL